MAIQIDEKLLSEKAKKMLSNAKSKSQLLRDALEYYVERVTSIEDTVPIKSITVDRQDEDILKELRDIKELIKQTSNVNAQRIDQVYSSIMSKDFKKENSESIASDNTIEKNNNEHKIIDDISITEINVENTNSKEIVDLKEANKQVFNEDEEIARLIDQSLVNLGI